MFGAHALLKYYVFTLPGAARFFQPLGLSAAHGGAEYPAFLAAAALVQALPGDGRFALANLFNARNQQGDYA
jgi:hypothetical protein